MSIYLLSTVSIIYLSICIFLFYLFVSFNSIYLLHQKSGPHKSGSTEVQNYLVRNYDYLLKLGNNVVMLLGIDRWVDGLRGGVVCSKGSDAIS